MGCFAGESRLQFANSVFVKQIYHSVKLVQKKLFGTRLKVTLRNMKKGDCLFGS